MWGEVSTNLSHYDQIEETEHQELTATQTSSVGHKGQTTELCLGQSCLRSHEMPVFPSLLHAIELSLLSKSSIRWEIYPLKMVKQRGFGPVSDREDEVIAYKLKTETPQPSPLTWQPGLSPSGSSLPEPSLGTLAPQEDRTKDLKTRFAQEMPRKSTKAQSQHA